MNPLRSRFRRDRRGVAALEFAIVGTVLISICLGTVEASLLFWTQNALQAAAAQTARCVAVGSSACSDAQSYAVGVVDKWMFSGVVAATDVTPASSTTCNGVSGTANGFERITIKSSYFTGWLPSLVPQFANKTITASACYPK